MCSQRRSQSISIHAPLAGCDHCRAIMEDVEEYFNPRTPCGVRRGRPLIAFFGQRISIHAPLAGCDDGKKDFSIDDIISIHAPLAGCDRAGSAPPAVCRYFNPRTPCGVRRTNTTSHLRSDLFQSTHPLRGATVAFVQISTDLIVIFQSTHPLRGATAKAHKKMRHFCAKGINTSSLCAKNAHPAT